MCLLYTRIDGVRYNLAQVREMYDNACEENATLNEELAKKEKEIAQLSTALGEAKKREQIAQKLYDKEKEGAAKLRQQIADLTPKRDRGGRFAKKS